MHVKLKTKEGTKIVAFVMTKKRERITEIRIVDYVFKVDCYEGRIYDRAVYGVWLVGLCRPYDGRVRVIKHRSLMTSLISFRAVWHLALNRHAFSHHTKCFGDRRRILSLRRLRMGDTCDGNNSSHEYSSACSCVWISPNFSNQLRCQQFSFG